MAAEADIGRAGAGGHRVSALVLTRDAGRGLPRLLRELADVVDEVVVGVDSAAVEGTLAAARAGADRVFRFEHCGPPVLIRLPALEYVTGDWVLSLDEDEGLDRALAALLPKLVSSDRYTHYYFPRKWIVAADPPQYLCQPPWFPDWQLRLFRNRPGYVWHPGTLHSGYRVMGAGCREERGSILHYEPVTLDEEARSAKLELYREHAGAGQWERYYRPEPGPRRRVETPPAAAEGRRSVRGELLERTCPARRYSPAPPWSAALDVRVASSAVAGQPLLVDVLAQNTGSLAWTPHAEAWPRLSLSFHLKTGDGELLEWDGNRIPVPRETLPGDGVRFLGSITAPTEPGAYRLEWDLVCEGDRWFSELGSPTAEIRLEVVAPGSR